MEKLIGLESNDFLHEWDKAALDKFRSEFFFRQLMTKFIHLGLERMFRIQLTGSCLKIKKDAYPDLHKVLYDAGTTLGFDGNNLPDFYLQYEPMINAYTTGDTQPMMVVYSGTIDLLTPEEQQYVIGHEFGHILCHHVLYHMIINSLFSVADFGVVTKALELPMFYWMRCSELSADRAGLLASQNLHASIRAMIKMAGLPPSHYDKINVDAFIEQAHNFDAENTDFWDETFKFLSIAYSSHPWLVLRASELLKWVESGEYDRVLNARKGIKCSGCGNIIGNEPKICPICGIEH